MWYYTETKNIENFVAQFRPLAKRNTEADFLYNPDYKDFRYICFETGLKAFFFRNLIDLMEYADDSEEVIYVDFAKQMEIE